jgi:hypothetical protein
MEAERRQLGLRGLRFLLYECQGCGQGSIFLHLLPLEGESPGALQDRRQSLETEMRRLRSDMIEVVVTERAPAWAR